MKIKHLIKAEISTTQKLLLSKMAEEQKRSVKKQTEFIIENALNVYSKKVHRS